MAIKKLLDGFVVDKIENKFKFYENQQFGFNMIAIFSKVKYP